MILPWCSQRSKTPRRCHRQACSQTLLTSDMSRDVPVQRTQSLKRFTQVDAARPQHASAQHVT
ncbi:unnamed protein product [Symbiodinium necroappetens]|uniref:Uncharacterized protein n=1 Tax=Symbiodinium necroappetens TaxID=1628268 RepID=A0A812TEH3_9DINO|nr:unnamed protein product [Symbiodinium necroappetens]